MNREAERESVGEGEGDFGGSGGAKAGLLARPTIPLLFFATVGGGMVKPLAGIGR